MEWPSAGADHLHSGNTGTKVSSLLGLLTHRYNNIQLVVVVVDCILSACIIIYTVQGCFGLQRAVNAMSQRQCIHCIQEFYRLKTHTQQGVFTYTTGK